MVVRMMEGDVKMGGDLWAGHLCSVGRKRGPRVGPVQADAGPLRQEGQLLEDELGPSLRIDPVACTPFPWNEQPFPGSGIGIPAQRRDQRLDAQHPEVGVFEADGRDPVSTILM